MEPEVSVGDSRKPEIISNALTAWVFFLILLLLGLFNIVLYSEKDTSDVENRSLAKMPQWSAQSFFDGSFGLHLENALKDQFFLREPMIRWSKKIEGWTGTGYQMVFSSAGIADNPNQRGMFYRTKYGWIMLFYRVPEFEALYADAILRFSERHPELQIYSMIIPSKTLFITDEGDAISSDQRISIDHVSGLLAASDRIQPIYLADAFAARDPRELYFRTDYHWNGAGSKLAYEVLCDALGDADAKALIKSEVYSGFLGNLIGQTGDIELQYAPDEVSVNFPLTAHVFYKYHYDEQGREVEEPSKPNAVSLSFSGGRASYAVYMGGDMPRALIRRTEPLGRGKILVFKDSYGNALAPLLVNVFDEVHVIDPRHYKGDIGELIEEQGITHALIVNIIDVLNNDFYIDLLDTALGGKEE